MKEWSMRKICSLGETRQQYVLGKMGKKEFEGLTFQYLLDNFERYYAFEGNREQWVDFLSWFYPRLSRAIDNYRETGSSFDAYIASIVRWASKEYRSREAEHSATEYACWKARAEETAVCSPEPEYGTAVVFPAPEEYSSRQILVLFLKSYYFISEDLLDKIAVFLNMDREELKRLVDELHRRRNEREIQIRDLQERIYCQYYRYMAFKKRLVSAVPGTAYYEKMNGRYDRARLRYARMKKRLAGIRLSATNREIAELLNIPKGTIDSTLYSMRQKLKPCRHRNAELV
jgi:DNA-directed RNA polymerase specialized sigma24 family protein